MKTNRRKFLSLLGVGTAAGPLAVKVATEQQVLGLTSLKYAGLSAGNPIDTYGEVGSQHVSKEAYVSPYIQANNYLKLWGKLPAFVEENLRERAKQVSNLDPDIACKKSWSLCVKISAQRERNYQNLLQQHSKQGTYQEAQSMFSKITGFQWPW